MQYGIIQNTGHSNRLCGLLSKELTQVYHTVLTSYIDIIPARAIMESATKQVAVGCFPHHASRGDGDGWTGISRTFPGITMCPTNIMLINLTIGRSEVQGDAWLAVCVCVCVCVCMCV